MARLQSLVKHYKEELGDRCAWVAFWREGRSWAAEVFYLDETDSLDPGDDGLMRAIREADPAAVVLNSYYCGRFGEDMDVESLTAGIQRNYEDRRYLAAEFLEMHSYWIPASGLDKYGEIIRKGEKENAKFKH